jgi:hypothetical protein
MAYARDGRFHPELLGTPVRSLWTALPLWEDRRRGSLPSLWNYVWYDEGIEPGNEWPEDVAKALDGSALFLVFISPNSIASRNVRNEINFALNRSKPFIAVHLVETKLPAGLALRTGDIQAILRYRMTADSY